MCVCVCVCVCVFVCVFVYMNYINNQYEIKKVYIYLHEVIKSVIPNNLNHEQIFRNL